MKDEDSLIVFNSGEDDEESSSLIKEFLSKYTSFGMYLVKDKNNKMKIRTVFDVDTEGVVKDFGGSDD